MRTRAFISKPGELKEAIVAFARYARANGMQVGVQEGQEALKAAGQGILSSKKSLRSGLKALFCTRYEDVALFDRLFDEFWSTQPETTGKTSKKIVNPSNLYRKVQSSLVVLGQGKTAAEEEEGKHVSGANAEERLRKTDFSKLSEIENEWLEELADRLWKEMSQRLKRRLRASVTKGKVDLRRTLRRNISHGGDPIELLLKYKKQQKKKLVILLDVSGSMDKYSFFLLRFIFSLKAHFRNLEAFIFSTHLERISEDIREQGLEATLDLLSGKTEHWSGGTRIGDCFRAFNDQYAKRVLHGRALVIVLSDGLDTGEPEVLGEELGKIALRAKKLIWLNPLKGTKDYAPTARGMSAALPHLDVFQPAHSLDSLLQLEKFLIDV